MALNIDELNIQIEADSKKATSAIDELANSLERLKTALSGMTTTTSATSNGLNKVEKEAKEASNATSELANKTGKATKSFSGFFAKLSQKISVSRTIVSVFQNIAHTMADWFNESNSYQETLNLFNVTMGEGAKEAMNYANKVSELVGIDPAEWMNYQGTFKQLTNGFGVASDKADIMSKNLTQLSYDLASFYNTSVETAFDKLSSAMAGQVKGLREFGIDTTVASLQEYALAKGIDKSVSSMTQAEKSLLRYNYILERSVNVQGDMARTLVTPANAMRVLTAQMTQMKRSLGNIVSVIVTKFIPYVQVMVKWITQAATAIAAFFGYELEAIDYSSLGEGFATGFSDAEDSVDGTSGKLKKLKKQLMGFDELNIISNPDSDSGSGSGGVVGGSTLNMEALEYTNFLEGLEASSEEIEKIKDDLKIVLSIASAIATAVAAWKVSTGFSNAVSQLRALVTGHPIYTITLGLILAITGFNLEFEGIKSVIQDGLNKLNFTEILSGGLLGSGGAAILGAGLAVLIDKAFGSSGVCLAITQAGINLGTSTMAGTGAAILGSVGAIIAGVPMYFTGIYDAIVNGLNWMNGLLVPLGSTLAGAGIGAVIGMLGGPIGAGIGALIGLAVGALTDLGLLIYEKWDEIKEYFKPFTTWFDTTIIQPIRDVLSNASTWVDENVVQPIIKFFQPIKDAFNEVKTYAVEKFTEIKDGIVERITTVWNKIVEIKDKIVEIFSALWWAFNEYIWNPIIDKVTTFYNEKIKPVIDDIKEGLKSIWNTIKEKVIDPIKEKLDNVKKKLIEIRDFVSEKFKEVGKDVIDCISGTFKKILNGIFSSIESKVNGFIRLLNGAIGIINKIPGVSITKVSEISLPRFAEGGFPDMGQMFIARERGPELVGTIGNKNAVANNDQIVSGIEAGVYRAMRAANSGNNGGNTTIRIINEIDGEVVGEKVIKYHNGVVRRTGESPLLV